MRKGKSGNIGKHEWKLTFAPKMHHLVSNALMVFNDDFLVVRRVVVDSSSCNHVVYCARASCETYRARARAHRTFPLCFNSTFAHMHCASLSAWCCLWYEVYLCNRAVAIESYLMSLMMRPYLSLKAKTRYLWAKYLSISLALCLLPDFHHDWWEICSRESHFKSVYKINFTLSS